MEHLRIGLNVDIKRSDGRIHSAVISSVNGETRSATVEWFEKGETKGKEVNLEAILDLNPQFSGDGGDDEQGGGGRGGGKEEPAVRKNTRKTMQPEPLHLQNNHVNGMLDSNDNNRQAHKKARVTQVTPGRQAGPSMAVSNGHSNSEDDISATVKPGQAPVPKARQSTTVREIERLKKNREERRAQQEEARRQQHEIKMELEPGNPNWSFLAMIRDYQSELEYRPLKITDPVDDYKISVCIRKRPINKREVDKKTIDVLTVPSKDHIIVHEPKTKVDLTKYLENQTFRFDYAFDDSTTNEMVYKFTAQPLVKTIFEGGYATCFAYGQTGSGKTHTMGGDFNGKLQDCSKGIYAFTARDVFKLLNKKYRKENMTVHCSFFEIYSGKVFDLLNNKTKLRILEDGKNQVQVVGLQEKPVEQEQDVLELIQRGNDIRTAGQTSANNNSSRSHAIFQIIIRKGSRKIHGKFSLIDLAGNERGVDTSSSSRQTRMEGAEINKSLLALKECIRALGRRNAHLPFRASKLTLVLRDSFVGENSRTCMIAMVSPGLNSCEHTLNTLRYADRVKELGANPEVGRGGDEDDYPMADTPNFSDSDLKLLHSHNESELSDELYNYQLGVDHLQETEDEMLEDYRDIVEAETKWLRQDKELLKSTEIVDYDCDAFAQKLDQSLEQRIARLSKLKDSVRKFREQLNEEEQIASKMTKRRH